MHGSMPPRFSGASCGSSVSSPMIPPKSRGSWTRGTSSNDAVMRRRDFLSLASLAPFGFAGTGQLALAAASRETGKLLVLVALRGGNDGINTVVPFGDPLYARLRPRLAIAPHLPIVLETPVAWQPSLCPPARV